MTFDQRICFVDLEATSADPLTAKMWEIGIVIREAGQTDGDDQEYTALIHPGSLAHADKESLRVTRFYERTKDLKPWDYKHSPDSPKRCPEQWANPWRTAREVAEITEGAIFVANNTTYDGPILDLFLRAHGQIGDWDYRHRDIGSAFDGWMAGYRTAIAVAQACAKSVDREDVLGILKTGAQAPSWPAPGLGNIVAHFGIDTSDRQSHRALDDARTLRDCWDAIFADGFRCQ
jgi:hypothetical protein